MSKSYLKFLLAFLAIFFVVWGGYFVWDRYFKYDPVKVYEKAEREYIEAMTADTYGGKTPQETLDMFVEALRAEDIELASKYFMLDENLSREKWVSKIQGVKKRNLLARMAIDIEKLAKPVSGSEENDFAFEIMNSKGVVVVLIDMQLNKFSGVWKIESL